MKKIFKSFLLLFAVLAMHSCEEGKKKQEVEVDAAKELKKEKKKTSDKVDSQFSDGMTGTVYHYYLEMRRSLFNSDMEMTKTAAGDIAESLDAEQDDLLSLAWKIEASSDIEEQRKLFSEFTLKFEPLLKENLSEGKIYKQYCPMAFNNRGAYWFSEIEKIENPYFGEKMHNCGSVKETIKSKK